MSFYGIKAVHEGYKPHVCSICGKSFTHPQRLKDHRQTVHEGQRVHTCVVCDKSFSRSDTLKKHMQTIHEEKY